MNFDTYDFYSDVDQLADPHEYFDFLRGQGPVTRLPFRNVVAVTGYEELVQLMLDTEHFSPINAVTGPIPDLPFEAVGDDITEQLEAARGTIPFSDQVVTQTGARHKQLRSLLTALFKPRRLKALDPKLHSTADALIDEFASAGRVDLVDAYGGPYATLVIADLLGVPGKTRHKFRTILQGAVPAKMGASVEEIMRNPLVDVGKELFRMIALRRFTNGPLIGPLKRLVSSAGDQDDILTELALARFPDGSKPTLVDLTSIAAFLFGAGQDTTNRLLANCFRVIATKPDIQEELRQNPKRIPDFVEELLRFDGSVKSGGRVCQKTTSLGGVEIKAGTIILMSHMAANRDPERFENPGTFDMDRAGVKTHLAFGRGEHTCIGAPLARREVAVSIERLLARMGNIRLDPEFHGEPGVERFDYEPTYILRALKSLHLQFDPV